MTIKKWDPFRDLIEMSGDMERMFEEDLGFRVRHPHTFRTIWAPAVDMCETDEEIVVRAELPGMNREDLIVEVVGENLVLRGECRFDKSVKHEKYHMIERTHGEFYRALRLPTPVMEDKIQANYRDGVLSISLPKTEEARTMKIPVVT